MFLEKLCYIKTNIHFRNPGTDLPPPAKCWVKDFILSGNLKHPKNVKSINNTTSSYLVSCCVIPRSATMKG